MCVTDEALVVAVFDEVKKLANLKLSGAADAQLRVSAQRQQNTCCVLSNSGRGDSQGRIQNQGEFCNSKFYQVVTAGNHSKSEQVLFIQVVSR